MNVLIWLESSSVSAWINQSDSILAYPTILLVHTIGLTLLVGINIAVDLRIFGFAPQIPVAEMLRLFPVMWTGLALSAASGALLLIAKATTMGVNPAFYIKMVSIVFAVAAVFAIRARMCRASHPDATISAQTSGKTLAYVSLFLWLVAITAGRIMAYLGEAAEFGLLVP